MPKVSETRGQTLERAPAGAAKKRSPQPGKTETAGRRAPPSRREDVRLAVQRCPFCRDRVSGRADDWLSCARCLARHHEACWAEAPRCGSCGCARTLRHARLPRRERASSALRQRGGLPLVLLGGATLGAAMLFVAVGLWLTSQPTPTALANERAVEVAVAQRAAERERVLAERHALELYQAAQASRDKERLAVSEELEAQWLVGARLEEARKAREAKAAAAEAAAEAARKARARKRLDLQNKGSQLYDEGDDQGALRLFDQALALDPDHPGCWHSRGVLLTRLKRYPQAIAACDEAIRLKPDFADPYVTRATAKRLRGDLSSAVADLDRAIELDPCHKVALSNRRVLRAKAGDLQGARGDSARLSELAKRQGGLGVKRRGDPDLLWERLE